MQITAATASPAETAPSLRAASLGFTLSTAAVTLLMVLLGS